MNPLPDLRCVTGAAIAPYLDNLARLRSDVFRDWPYLYDGDAAYEADYLQVYARSPHSIAVLALDAGQVVGAATGVPLVDESAQIREPFEQAGLDAAGIFYCGESVLLPRYRGHGLGHRFFAEREAHARRLGFGHIAFCSVHRASDDPRRPAIARDNDAFWRKRGYRPVAGLRVSMAWREVDRGEVPHVLDVWMRPLEHAP